MIFGNRSPAPHFRPIRPPGIANYSQEISLNEPGALDERLRETHRGAGQRKILDYLLLPFALTVP